MLGQGQESGRCQSQDPDCDTASGGIINTEQLAGSQLTPKSKRANCDQWVIQEPSHVRTGPESCLQLPLFLLIWEPPTPNTHTKE